MFSLGNFIRFIAVLLLAGGTAKVPFISDIPRLLGGGTPGNVFGFVISVIFWWFVVGQVLAFLSFAIGGGVGRYNTAKLYRRMQWLTSEGLICIPIIVALPFVVNLTPWAGTTPQYKARVQAEKDRRLSEARADRAQRIEAMRASKQREYDAAHAEYSRQVRAAQDRRAHAIRTKIALLEKELGHALVVRKNLVLLAKEQGRTEDPFIRRRAEIEARHRSHLRIFDHKLARLHREEALERFAIIYADQNAVGNKSSFTFLVANAAPDFAKYESNLWSYCQHEGLFGQVCNALGVIESEALPQSIRLAGDAALSAQLGRTARRIKHLRALADELAEPDSGVLALRADYRAKIGAVSTQEPAVDLSNIALVRRSDYLPIKEEEFVLRIDASPVNVRKDRYIEGLEPTIDKFALWFIPMGITAWIVLLRRMLKPALAVIYSRAMRFLDKGRMGYGGSARFATMFEEWGKPYEAGKLYMGRSLYNPLEEIGMGGEAHMLTVAGSRGGKGATAIIPNLLLWNGSAIVIDPKGTNARVTANARRAMGHDVHIIDPFGIVSDESARFDPLEGLAGGGRLIREKIASIADGLVVPDEHQKEQHWDDGARTLIAGLIAQIISQNPDDAQLYDIRDLIRLLPEEQDSLWAAMAFNEEGGGGYAKDAAARYIRGSHTNEILGLMSNADKHTEWLSSPIMREVTSNPTFSIADIKKKPATIYLVIPPRQLERQNRLLRLFINLAIDAVEEGGRSKIPVLLMTDEFLAMGKMNEITNAFATMASYNLILWPFVQDIGRMQELYGEGFTAFVTNSRAIQVFAIGDQRTKEFVSEKFGSRPGSGVGNIAKSNDNLPLRTPNDIEKDISAEEGRQYIIETGRSPMILEKVPYYYSSPAWWWPGGGRFKGKYDPDPDFG